MQVRRGGPDSVQRSRLVRKQRHKRIGRGVRIVVAALDRGLDVIVQKRGIRSSAQSKPRRMKLLLGLGVATTLSVALVSSAATGAR